MDAYYSNLIEGHNTLSKDIARALAGDFAQNADRRDLQIEALVVPARGALTLMRNSLLKIVAPTVPDSAFT